MKPTDKEIRAIAESKYVKYHSGFINEQIDLDRGRNARIKSFIEGFQEAISLQPEWVSVAERLPEVTDYTKRVYHAVMSDQGHYNYKALAWYGDPMDGDDPGFQVCDAHSSIGRFPHVNVTHWFELPQPPTK